MHYIIKNLSLLSLTFGSLGLIGLSSCTFLPSSGPSGYKIKADSGYKKDGLSYKVFRIDEGVLGVVKQHSPHPTCLAVNERGIDASFRERGLEKLGEPAKQTIQPGDLINIAIVETDARLFVPSLSSGTGMASPITALPSQRLDQSGKITVPYIGRVHAAGRMPSEVEAEIKESLKLKTADAQVLLSVSDRAGGNMVTIAGDVRLPARIPLSPSGTRVLDAISASGGCPGDPFDYMVTVTRGGSSLSDPLRMIYDNPQKNINLQAGDAVVIRKRVLNFLAFGATGKIAKIPINVEDLSLTEAMADTGGANDMQANPANVFVYRLENPAIPEKLGAKNVDSGAKSVPVIYQIQLNDPRGYFYANQFTIRDRDIIFYASAGSVGLMKFMNILNTLAAPAVTGLSGMSAAKVLSN
jgi:polysaccharide export outer membrane protein